jgi:hypothetical protein
VLSFLLGLLAAAFGSRKVVVLVPLCTGCEDGFPPAEMFQLKSCEGNSFTLGGVADSFEKALTDFRAARRTVP